MKKVHLLDYKDVLALFLPAGILDYFENNRGIQHGLLLSDRPYSEEFVKGVI
jgi:hypothetical protein